MRKLLAILALVVAFPAAAQWDATKPQPGPADPAEIRRNWTALEQTTGGVNLVADPTPLIWAAGDAAAPTYYTLAGAGAAVARTGTGLGDTSRQLGAFAAKVTSAAAAAQLYQTLLSAASWDTGFRSLGIACGAYAKSSTSSTARVYASDGTATTYSSYHTGSGAFAWLTVAHTISASASGPLVVGLDVATGTKVGYMQALTCVLGSVPPKLPKPGTWARGDSYRLTIAGAVTTGTTKARWTWPWRAGLVDDVQLYAGTAPTGQALIVDVNTWDGAAFTSMFATRPQIAAGANRGNAAPDGTYARRAFVGLHGTSVSTGGELTIDVDQVGSGTAGSDLVVSVRPRFPVRPLEAFMAVAE